MLANVWDQISGEVGTVVAMSMPVRIDKCVGPDQWISGDGGGHEHAGAHRQMCATRSVEEWGRWWP